MGDFISVFFAGLLASLSGCVYGLIPITVGYFGSQGQHGRKTSVSYFILGQAFALTTIGILAARIGETLGFTSQSPWIRVFVGVFLIVSSVWSVRGRLPRFLERLNQNVDSVAQVAAQVRSHNRASSVRFTFVGPFLLGVSAALVASPCTTPILGGVLSMVATSSTLVRGGFLMLTYSFGFSLLLGVLGLGVGGVSRLPRAGRWLKGLQLVSSALLVGLGLYYIATAVMGT